MTAILEGLKYTKEHEWAKIQGDVAIIGITDYAQHALTDIVFAEIPQIGKEVQQFKSLTTLESVKSVSDVYAPLSGKVVEANTELEKNSALINTDPYGRGWIAKIKIKDSKEEKNLMDKKQYEEYLKSQGH